MLKIGIVKTSLKANERRVPVYPEHLPWIPGDVRKHLIFEKDYGEDYGYKDEFFIEKCGGMLKRKELFECCDVIVLPKPVVEDLKIMRKNQVLWGWTHCIQQRDIAQEAIERNLTLISWESMHQWSDNGEKGMHIFHKNNEIAGYAAVLHTLQLLGIDGYYGPRRTVAVLGYGSVSRGAIYALQGRGFNNIRVYTRRPTYLIACQNPDVYYFNYSADESGSLTVKFADGSTTPLINELSKADIICNGILQDVDRPVLFVNQADIEHLQNPTIIIDISCDRGMGFSFARPTSFSEPIIKIADRIHYYSVDHTASYIWNAASREISRSLIPFIGNISEGPDSWEQNSIIRNAIDIKDGKVRNKKILSFQKRI